MMIDRLLVLVVLYTFEGNRQPERDKLVCNAAGREPRVNYNGGEETRSTMSQIGNTAQAAHRDELQCINQIHVNLYYASRTIVIQFTPVNSCSNTPPKNKIK